MIRIFTISFIIFYFSCLGSFAYTKADTTLAIQYLSKAETLCRATKLDSGIYYYKKAQEICLITQDWHRLIQAYNGIGRTLFMKRDMKNAFEVIKQGVQIARKHEDIDGLTFILVTLGNGFHFQSEYDSALSVFKEIILLNQKSKNPKIVELSKVYNNMAIIYGVRNEFDEAISAYQKSIELKTQFKDSLKRKEGIASSYLNLGTLYKDMGDPENALKYAKMAEPLNIEVWGERHPSVAKIVDLYGDIYLTQNDLERAFTYFNQAIKINQEAYGPDHVAIADGYRNLCNVYIVMNKADSALFYINKSLKIFEKQYGQGHFELGVCYYHIAQCYHMKGQEKKAKEFIGKAITIYQKKFGPNHSSLLSSYHALADIAIFEKKYNEALSYLEKAEPIIAAIYSSKNINIGTTYYYKAKIYFESGQQQKAMENIQQALIQLSSNFTDKDVFHNPDLKSVMYKPKYLDFLEFKADILASDSMQIDKCIEALTCYSSCLSVIETMIMEYNSEFSKELMVSRIIDISEKGIALSLFVLQHAAKPDVEDLLFSFMERSKSSLLLNDIQKTTALEFSGIPHTLVGKDKHLQIQIAFYEKQYAEAMAKNDSLYVVKWSKKLYELKHSYDDLIALFKAKYPHYYNLKHNLQAASIQDIRKNRLKQNEAFIEYFWGDSLLVTFVITSTELFYSRQPINDDLLKLIDSMQRILSKYDVGNGAKSSYNEFTITAQQLFNKLLPSEVYAVIGKKEKLIIVPDGPLSFISFDVLLTDSLHSKKGNFKDLSYLIKKYQILYAYSGTLMTTQSVLSKSANVYLGFAPNYNKTSLESSNHLLAFRSFRGDVMNLSGNKKEVENTNHLLGGQAFFDGLATEYNFKQYAKDFKILHLAMHALTDDKNPLYSKLIFSQQNDSLDDGFLNAYELFNMNLNAQLAVLSACQTGFGKLIRGEGVRSLARAFKYSGCDNIIMTLWRADDQSSASIISDFFKELKSGKDMAGSLQKAKIDYLSNADPLTAHPYFWSGFILVGDNSSIELSDSSNTIRWMVLSISFLLIGLVMLFLVRKRKNNRI